MHMVIQLQLLFFKWLYKNWLWTYLCEPFYSCEGWVRPRTSASGQSDRPGAGCSTQSCSECATWPPCRTWRPGTTPPCPRCWAASTAGGGSSSCTAPQLSPPETIGSKHKLGANTVVHDFQFNMSFLITYVKIIQRNFKRSGTC